MAFLLQNTTSHCNGCKLLKSFLKIFFLKNVYFRFCFSRSPMFTNKATSSCRRATTKNIGPPPRTSKPMKIVYQLREIFHNGYRPIKDNMKHLYWSFFSKKMFGSIVNTPLTTCKNNFGEHCPSKDQQGTLSHATRLISNQI